MKKETNNKIIMYIPLIIGVVCICFVLIVLMIPEENAFTSDTLSDSSSINEICELATLKSFYHNVVVYEKEPNGGDKFFNDVFMWPFGNLIKKGYKQYWIEYSGIVETGIDATLIQYKLLDSENVIEVYVPDAKVLNVYVDSNSFSDPITEKGLFTDISSRERLQAYSKAQNLMQEEAENDRTLLRKAKENAKTLLKEYYVSFGEKTGVDYTVRWIDDPL